MLAEKCSIIICTYSRLEYLKQCLSTLLKLDFMEYEIIVVNDGSTDGTQEYLNTLNHHKLKIIHHDVNQGLSIARNTGIKNAKYDIIAFTDDDCLPEKNWLTELLKGFNNKNVGLVIGQVFYREKNYQGYFPERLVSNIDAKWPMGCNIAYQKKVFEVCGGFNNSFFKYNNEDSEMAIRAVSQNFDYKRMPSAIIYHQAINWTVKSLLKSARNASVWPVLKKLYPKEYLKFGPPIKFSIFINIKDYLYLLTSPILIPLLLIRYLIHGKKDLKIFFTKWPIYLILRRYYIYKEAVKNRVFMV